MQFRFICLTFCLLTSSMIRAFELFPWSRSFILLLIICFGLHSPVLGKFSLFKIIIYKSKLFPHIFVLIQLNIHSSMILVVLRFRLYACILVIFYILYCDLLIFIFLFFILSRKSLVNDYMKIRFHHSDFSI